MVACTKDETSSYEPGPADSDTSAQLYFADQSTSILLMPTDAYESEVTVTRGGATPEATYYVQVISDGDGMLIFDNTAEIVVGTTTIEADEEAGTEESYVDETIEAVMISFAEGETEAKISFSFPDAEIGVSYPASLAIYSDEAALYKQVSLSFSVMVSYTWTLVTGEKGETTATWTEGLLSSLFSSSVASKDVEIYEAAEIPGYYRIRNIYDTNFVADLWGGTAEEEEGYALDPNTTEDYFTYIHAEDPDNVWIEYCDTGYFLYYDDYGNFVFWSYVPDNAAASGYAGSDSCYGVYEDGVITFAENTVLVTMSVYGGAYYGGSGVTITMPGVEIFSAMNGITYNGCFTDSNRNQYAVVSFDVNETAASVKYALVEGSSVDVDAVAAGIVDGTVESTEVTEFSNVYVSLPGAGTYSVVGVTFSESGAAGAVSSDANVVTFTISSGSDDAPFSMASGETVLNGYSYFYETWYTEDLVIDYDSSTGAVLVSGLFEGSSSVVVEGTYDNSTRTITLPGEVYMGTFTFEGYGDYDVYLLCYDADVITFTLDATETMFESSDMWGYYIDGLDWYDIYSSSYFYAPAGSSDGNTGDVTHDDGYETWLGTWDLTSTSLTVSGTPLTVEVVIAESTTVSNQYDIYGFDLSVARNTFAMPATYDSTTGGWTVLGSSSVGTYSGYTMMYCAYAWLGGSYQDYYIITGDYDALTATMGSDDASGSIACGSGEISDGTAFDVVTVCLFASSGDSYASFENDTTLGVDESDVLIGPYTLAKTSDSTTVPSAASPSAAPASKLTVADKAFTAVAPMTNSLKAVKSPVGAKSIKQVIASKAKANRTIKADAKRF